MLRTMIILSLASCCWVETGKTQTIDQPPLHHHTQRFVDGSLHPELIPDSEARRLFLVALAQPSGDQDTKITNSLRRAHYTRIGLTDEDQRRFSEILDGFKVEYQRFIARYNDAANEAIKNGQAPDSASFLNERDILVRNTYEQLKQSLSSQAAASMDEHIKTEKMRMKVPQQ